MEPSLKLQVNDSRVYVQSKLNGLAPHIAVVLGSGLGTFADAIENPLVLNVNEIPHYPRSTVPGHHGRWFVGEINRLPVIGVQGRVHYYEGYSLSQVTYPVHLLASLGVKILILTTACGGLNPAFKAGELMIITDQINFTFHNPLVAKPENLLGPRFPDMIHCYDPELIRIARAAGRKLDLPLQSGVFCWMAGPAYETAAEVKMLHALGGDAVSMSTAPEVITARQRHVRVLGIALITNPGTGITLRKVTHQEVTDTANRAGKNLSRLLVQIIGDLGKTKS